MNENSKGIEPSKEFEWITSPDGVKRIYSNYVRSNWTLFDVTVVLGQIIPRAVSGSSKGFFVEERATVTFAWPHAKVLHRLLGDLLKSYEEANGEIQPIKLPQDPTTAAPPAEEAS
jgi:hypothetical protein